MRSVPEMKVDIRKCPSEYFRMKKSSHEECSNLFLKNKRLHFLHCGAVSTIKIFWSDMLCVCGERESGSVVRVSNKSVIFLAQAEADACDCILIPGFWKSLRRKFRVYIVEKNRGATALYWWTEKHLNHQQCHTQTSFSGIVAPKIISRYLFVLFFHNWALCVHVQWKIRRFYIPSASAVNVLWKGSVLVFSISFFLRGRVRARKIIHWIGWVDSGRLSDHIHKIVSYHFLRFFSWKFTKLWVGVYQI